MAERSVKKSATLKKTAARKAKTVRPSAKPPKEKKPVKKKAVPEKKMRSRKLSPPSSAKKSKEVRRTTKAERIAGPAGKPAKKIKKVNQAAKAGRIAAKPARQTSEKPAKKIAARKRIGKVSAKAELKSERVKKAVSGRSGKGVPETETKPKKPAVKTARHLPEEARKLEEIRQVAEEKKIREVRNVKGVEKREKIAKEVREVKGIGVGREAEEQKGIVKIRKFRKVQHVKEAEEAEGGRETAERTAEGIKAAREKKEDKSPYPVRKEESLSPHETLPSEYGENGITLIVVDPRKIFMFWEMRKSTLKIFRGDLSIRIYDITGADVDSMKANSFFDIPIGERIGSLYLDVRPARDYVADVGIVYEGLFLMIARSNRVSTPRGVPPPVEPVGAGLPIGY
ncbi:MAG: DUF4912 domain-containing protein [Nitrospirota bacterium]